MERIVLRLQNQWNDNEYKELKASLQDLIYKMAHSFLNTHPTKYSFKEFTSLADSALYRAIIHFKPGNTKFSTYFTTILKNEFISFDSPHDNRIISETDYNAMNEDEEGNILEKFGVDSNYLNIFRQLDLQKVYVEVIKVLKTKKSTDYKVFQKLWYAIKEGNSYSLSSIAKEVNVTSTSVLYSIKRIKKIVEEKIKKIELKS